MKTTIKKETEKNSGFLIGCEGDSAGPVILTTFKGEETLSIALQPKEADILAELLANRKKAFENSNYIKGRTIYGTLDSILPTEERNENHS